MKVKEPFRTGADPGAKKLHGKTIVALLIALSFLSSFFPVLSHAVSFNFISPSSGQTYDDRFNVAGSATADEGNFVTSVGIYMDGLPVISKSCGDNATTCTADWHEQKPTSPLVDAKGGAHYITIVATQKYHDPDSYNNTHSSAISVYSDRMPVISQAIASGDNNDIVVKGVATFKGSPGSMKYTFRTDTGTSVSAYVPCDTLTCNFSYLNRYAQAGLYAIEIEAKESGYGETTTSTTRPLNFKYMPKSLNVASINKTSPSFETCAFSTFNIATGNVSHDQKLYGVSTGLMAQDFNLFYSSRDAVEVPVMSDYQLPLGRGWSHTYDISLFFNTVDNTVVLRGGGLNRRVYTLSNGAYQSQQGDTSTLAKDSLTGGYAVTHVDGLVYNFNSLGVLTSIVDRYGNKTTVSGVVGGVQSITDPSNRVTRLTYTAGKITQIQDPDLKNYYFTYNTSTGLLSQVQYPAPTAGAASPTWTYDYNAMNLLEYKTNPEQQIVKYVYDQNGVLTSAINPDGVVDKNGTENPEGHTRTLAITPGTTVYTYENGGSSTYTYDAANSRVLSKADPLGNKTTYSYDEQGYLASKEEPVNESTKFTTTYLYDSHGNIAEEKGYSTHYQYDSNGNIISSTADAPIIHMGYEYDFGNFDQLKKVTNYLETPNTVTTYAYDTDSEGYLRTTITDPSNYQTIIRRYSNGNILDQTYPNGQKLTYAYDSKGVLQSVTNPSGVKLLFENYDMKGNPGTAKVIDANQAVRQTTTLEYDALGRNTKNTVAGTLTSYITQYGYDKKGNMVSVTDAGANTTSMAYTFRDQVKSQTDALARTTTFERGSTCTSCGGVDKITAVIDANQHRTVFEYDPASNLKKETDANGKSIIYEYYPGGRVSKKIDNAGNTMITYSYDGLGRLTRRDYNDADHTWDAFTYGPNGQIATASNQNISYTYDYYPNGWLKKVTDSLVRVVSYDEYDGAGQRKKVTAQPGTAEQKVLTYGYDTKARLSTITSAAGTFTFGYDELGRRSNLTYPNGITTTYTYHQDQPSWLAGIKYQGTASTLYNVSYTEFDKTGNRKTRVQDGVAATFTYDLVYRLLGVASPVPETYQFDAVGNMVMGPLTTQTRYQYDDANRQLANPTMLATFDDQGNLKTSGVWSYGWSPAGQLIKSTGDVREVTYKYDPFGRRIERNWREFNSYNYTYTYLYDGDDVVMSWKKDVNSGATLEANHYVHRPGVDEHLAMTRGTTPYFYLADGNNNTLKVAKQDQSIAQTYTYDSYGVYTNGLTFDQPYQFAGRELDRETYLYFNRARYYSPRAKRFVSKDPIISNSATGAVPFSQYLASAVNQFAYVENSPVNYVDPSGLWRIPYTIYVEALKDTNAKFYSLNERHNGQGDAYRHCLASCMLAREDGNAVAVVLGWANEKMGDISHNQEKGEREMDEFNNAKGRDCSRKSSSTQDCQQACFHAAHSGSLINFYQKGSTRAQY